jgi:hypothetical protein
VSRFSTAVRRAALGLVAAAALASCSSAPPKRPAAPAPASIALKRISPAPGSYVDAGTIVRARVVYVLPAGHPGDYRVTPWFAIVDGGQVVVRGVGGIGSVVAPASRGEATIEFPLLRVLGAAKLTKPVQIWFALEMRSATGELFPAAHVGPFLFTAGAR